MPPFTNLSNDPDQQYFADGITENLTTDLSGLSFAEPMFVISSNPAARPHNIKHVGADLKVSSRRWLGRD
jgi:adenylate cyclase